MANRITVAPQGNGTQVWTNHDDESGDEIDYLFVPKSQLVAGDRVEDMAIFRRKANGQGLERATETGRGVLSANDINALPAGSFLRLRNV